MSRQRIFSRRCATRNSERQLRSRTVPGVLGTPNRAIVLGFPPEAVCGIQCEAVTAPVRTMSDQGVPDRIQSSSFSS